MNKTPSGFHEGGGVGRRERIAVRSRNTYYHLFRGQRVGYLFISPALRFVLGFTLYPLLPALLLIVFVI
jgi:hypothetical protein